jgi:hypothetical protein
LEFAAAIDPAAVAALSAERRANAPADLITTDRTAMLALPPVHRPGWR